MTWIKGLSLAAKAALALAVLALLAFAGWWTFGRPAHLKAQAVQAHAAAVQSDAVAGAARQSMDIVVHTQETLRTIDVSAEKGSHEILTAPGADARLSPDLVARGRSVLCLQHDRAGDPVCAVLLHGDGGLVGAGQADPARSGPGN